MLYCPTLSAVFTIQGFWVCNKYKNISLKANSSLKGKFELELYFPPHHPGKIYRLTQNTNENDLAIFPAYSGLHLSFAPFWSYMLTNMQLTVRQSAIESKHKSSSDMPYQPLWFVLKILSYNADRLPHSLQENYVVFSFFFL